MNILVLNGSPRANGNTVAMIDAFADGAKANGHQIKVFNVCQKKISGCLGCEHCHTKGNGQCIQQDDMQELYSLLAEAEMLVLASPIYYFGFTGQLQCAIHRTYAIGIPRKLKKAALILSSGSDNVYEGAIYEYKQIVEYMKLEDLGICTAHGYENKSEKKLAELKAWGRKI